ncbi:DNA polymerase III subunit epsilon [Alphaproteobacteria bacterium]
MRDGHRLVEIGCVELINKTRTGKHFHTYLNPQREIDGSAFAVHGLSSEFLNKKPVFSEIARDFLRFIGTSRLVIHNAPFDLQFLNQALASSGLPLLQSNRVLDTLLLARKKYPGSPASLDALCKRFDICLKGRARHGALIDAELLASVYMVIHGTAQVEIRFADICTTSKHNSPYSKFTFTENEQMIEHICRNFNVSAEEKALHERLVHKIKNPIWHKQK